MPELHEIMNIFADKDGGGTHPPMPSVSEITGKPWLTKGRYHFAETDHIIHGFDFKDVEIWWDWRETTTFYAPPSYPNGTPVPMTSVKTDYAGYKLERQLWEGADSVESKFNTALIDLRNVAVVGTTYESTSYATSTHWKIAGLVAKMDDFFVEQQELLLEKVRTLFDKDAPIQGNAANMLANHLYNLGSRLENLSTQLDRFHNAVNNIRPRIIPAISALAEAIDTRAKGPDTSMYNIIYDWYNGTSNGTQRFNTARDQFEIKYADGLWGIVGDSITDAGVNAELHRRWNRGLAPVVKAANNLYDVMSEVYTDIATDIRPITNPKGRNLPGFGGPGSTSGGGGGGGGGGDLPEIEFPEITIPPPTFTGGPGGGGNLPPPVTVGGPGGGGNLPPFPDLGGPGGGNSLGDLPPPTTVGGPGGGGDLPPPVTLSGPGDGSGLGDFGAPPPLLPSTTVGGPGGGSGLPGPRRGGLALDPETGLPVDPATGRPFPVDPDTGLPYHPDTGLPVELDPETGLPLPIDPLTGETITTAGPGSGVTLDPETGLPVDPATGRPFPVDPDTGLPYHPNTGLPVLVDPDTGIPYPIDPQTGLPHDPDTGLPMALDPETGRPYPVDPVTGLPVDPDTGLPVTTGGPGSGSGLDLPDYDLPRVETPDFDGDGAPGAAPPRSYSTVGPGPGSGLTVPGGADGGSGTGDRSSLFTTPQTLSRAGGSPGQGGFMTPPPIAGGAGGAGSPGGSAGAAAQQPGMGGMPPMMPMAGNQNNQERTRSTWLSEDERVWGTSRKDQRSVLGRPLPGEERKGSIRERVDTGAGGAGSRTASQTDGGVRAGKRKPGVGSRRGRLQGPDGGREGERQGGTG